MPTQQMYQLHRGAPWIPRRGFHAVIRNVGDDMSGRGSLAHGRPLLRSFSIGEEAGSIITMTGLTPASTDRPAGEGDGPTEHWGEGPPAIACGMSRRKGEVMHTERIGECVLRLSGSAVFVLMQASAFYPAGVSALVHHLPRPFMKLFIRELNCVSDWGEREPVLRSLLLAITAQLAKWGVAPCTDVPGAFALLWEWLDVGPVESVSDEEPWAIWQFSAGADSLPCQQWAAAAAAALRLHVLERCVDVALVLNAWLVPEEVDEPVAPTARPHH